MTPRQWVELGMVLFILAVVVGEFIQWRRAYRGRLNRRITLPPPYRDERDWIRAFRDMKP